MLVQHLRSRDQFQRVLDGARTATTEHFALHRYAGALPGARSDPSTDLWIGAMVPKRWARRAVTRNLLRRQIYAVVHELHERLMPACYVVRLRVGFDRDIFVSAKSKALSRLVREELQRLLSKAASTGPGSAAPREPTP